MRTPIRLGAYAAGLAALFTAALAAGHLVGPTRPAAKPAPEHGGMTAGPALDPAGEHGGHAETAGESSGPIPAGLQVAEDGYAVTLSGDLTPGKSSPLTLSVSKDGKPVTDLQPYLGAYGHLVVLRDGDLAYLHVHPDGAPGDGKTSAGPEIRFFAEVPSAGSYRLYLDFRHGGTVRTAAFTADTDHTHG